ncbi:MAG: hypothetical protein KGI52_17765, partial [Burkholderiales bacterium]|nr:hypothetical protein [Burkholderiales bacterium]
MHHPGSLKPASIANERNEIQIVDTHKSSETSISTGMAANLGKINRTLVKSHINLKRMSCEPVMRQVNMRTILTCTANCRMIA